MKPILTFVLAVLVMLPLVTLAQDTSTRPAVDRSGKGAILCAYEIYLTIQEVTKLCEWSRTATDEAIDYGIARIEQFIIDNASASNPREMINVQRERVARRFSPAIRGYCRVMWADTSGSIEFLHKMRIQPADDVQAIVVDLLSIPREPVMNPCL